MTITKEAARRIGLLDRKAIDSNVKLAGTDPDEFSYSEVFKGLMPKLYVMRERGCSFAQIHRMLNEAGLPIAFTTVRTYYSRFLPEMLGVCKDYAKHLHTSARKQSSASRK